MWSVLASWCCRQVWPEGAGKSHPLGWWCSTAGRNQTHFNKIKRSLLHNTPIVLCFKNPNNIIQLIWLIIWLNIDFFCKHLEPFLGQENLKVLLDIDWFMHRVCGLMFIYSTMGNKICTSQPQPSIFIHAISWRDWCFQVSLIKRNESNTAVWNPSASSNLSQQLRAPPELRSCRLNLRCPSSDSWFPWCWTLWGHSHQLQSASLQKTFMCMSGFLCPNDQACTYTILSG